MKVTLNLDVQVETDEIVRERELAKALDTYFKDANKRAKAIKVLESKIVKVKK